jgi:lipoate-protein ligase A
VLKNRDPWLLLDSGLCDYAFNMALDETLLELAAELVRPMLHFYGWSQPAASFGYFQRIADIEAVTPLRPLVRRPTGGGLVPHDADWTYSVAIPPNHSWYGLRAPESYARMHQWIQRAFTALGVATELASCCRKEIPGQCFAGYEMSDLLRLGGKIAGAAQRRTKTGLLIQGSVQPSPPNVTREQWQRSMCEVTGNDWSRLELSARMTTRVHVLVSEKYSRDEYNRRR